MSLALVPNRVHITPMRTTSYSDLRKNLAARNPASLEVCALLLKEGMQKVEPDLRYVGFRLPDEFVVGYGLDVAERYRNLDDLRVYVGPGSGH